MFPNGIGEGAGKREGAVFEQKHAFFKCQAFLVFYFGYYRTMVSRKGAVVQKQVERFKVSHINGDFCGSYNSLSQILI
jgi:hypothetical protein